MTPVLTLTRPCDEEVYLPEALAAAAMLHRTYGHARWLLLERRTRVLDPNRTLVPDPERVAAAHRALARHEAAALVVRRVVRASICNCFFFPFLFSIGARKISSILLGEAA